MIDIKNIIEGLKIERECVSRDCDRNCADCDLVQNRDWLLSVYDGAIALLKKQDTVHPETSCEIKYLTECCCDLCGVQLIKYDRFCRGCGKRIEWEGR